MKKVIALVATAVVAVSVVCAQVTVGAKGTFGMNLGSKLDGELADGAKNAFMVNGGGSIYGRYNMPFLPALGVQLEFGLTANNGAGMTGEIDIGKKVEYTTTTSYLSLDLPLLVTYDIPVSSVVITPMVGLNFSIPVGAPTMTNILDGEKEKEKIDGAKVTGFIPGIVAGVEVGIPAGPGSVTAGLSYVSDFTPVQGKVEGFDETDDVLTRRNFNISVGYALKF